MGKKSKLDMLLSDTGKAAKSLLDNAVQAIDQNDDGRFDLSDVSLLARSMGSAVKKGTQAMKESVDDTARSLELKALRPIFSSAVDTPGFLLPKFIHIVDRDKKRAESEACRGSIGYLSSLKGLQLVNIFRDSVEAFGLSLYPDRDCEFYYADPCGQERYIALNEYFSYLRLARVNELQKIAQDLGAKHFKVVYKEEQASSAEKRMRVRGKAPVSASAEHLAAESKYTTVEVAAEMSFSGHTPVLPQLKYLQRDPSIQALIAMRMDEKAPLLRQSLQLKLSNSSGMQESDALKIDAVLRHLKCSGHTTMTSEAKSESRRYLEYDIEF